MRKGIVAYVVYQSGQWDQGPLFSRNTLELAAIAEERERSQGEMVRADGMLEASVVGGRIDQERVSELSDVTQALKWLTVEYFERRRIYLNVVPERITDDFESGRTNHPFR